MCDIDVKNTSLYGLQALGDVFSAFAAALGAADKVVELIQRLPQMPGPGRLAPGSFAGHLELKDVEFSYPSRPDTRVLNGVSLSVKPGEASPFLTYVITRCPSTHSAAMIT